MPMNTLVVGIVLASSLLLVTEPIPQTSDLAAGMDTSISPGDDFFAYANGKWLRNTPIPPDRSSFGIFANLSRITQERVANLIRDTAASAPAADPVAQKIADYYNSIMDVGRIEAEGLSRLQPTLGRID